MMVNLTDEKQDYQYLLELSEGEHIYRENTSLVVKLPPGRRILTSSWINGGFQENLECVFNHQIPHSVKSVKDLEGGTITNYLSSVSKKLGFNPEKTTAIMTAANMKNVAFSSMSFRNLEVTAIVTAGVEINGGRAGDTASYYEEESNNIPISGTINTILIINADLQPFAMTKTIITAVEAKSVALQELAASSKYSYGIATGTGTDMISIVCNMNSKLKLTDGGKHSKLGELIGKCVIKATKLALEKQSGLSVLSQRNALVRLERFGIEENDFWKKASQMEGENRKILFFDSLRELAFNPVLVSTTTAVLHLVDEVSWGLLSENSAKTTAFSLIGQLPQMLNISIDTKNLINEYETIIENLVYIIAWISKYRTFTNS